MRLGGQRRNLVWRPERAPARVRQPQPYERPAVGERANAVDEGLAADRVENHVNAPPVGELACSLGEVLADVVDPVIETELLQALELLIARRRREHGRSSLLGELDRGHPDPAGSGVDQSRLAALEVAGGEQALLGGR